MLTPKLRKVGGKPVRGIQGLRLRTDSDPEPDEDAGIHQDTSGIHQPELDVYREIVHPNAINQGRYTSDTSKQEMNTIAQQQALVPTAESFNVNAHRNDVSDVYRGTPDNRNSALESDKTRYTSTFPHDVSPAARIQNQGGILQQVRSAIREHRFNDAEALMARYPNLADWSYERAEIARTQEGHAA